MRRRRSGEDGTSRFKGRNRWGTFYSVSGGWNIEQENFMQDVDFIDILKLRAGWGTAGNQNVTAYATEDRYMPNYNSTFGGVVAPGYVQTQIGNENLKWGDEQPAQCRYRRGNVPSDLRFLD